MNDKPIGLLFVLLLGSAAMGQTRFAVRERAPQPRTEVAPRIVESPPTGQRVPLHAGVADRATQALHRRAGVPDLDRFPRVYRGGQPAGCTPVLHHGPSGYWRHVRERVWVPGACRWVTYPARYEWRYDRCGRRYRVLCEPARQVQIQEPGYWDWQVRRIWVPTC